MIRMIKKMLPAAARRPLREIKRRLLWGQMMGNWERAAAACQPPAVATSRGKILIFVITSYSIHYTKLYEPEMRATDRALKAFLFPNMYRHHKVMRATTKARRVVDDLFGLLLSEPRLLPGDWRRRCDGPAGPATAQEVCDYVAGMTDRFARNNFV